MRNVATASVYVIESDAGLVKVGRSQDPQARLKCIATAAPGALRLVHSTASRDDSSYVEAAAHRLLADKRRAGEWFDVTAAEAVAAVKEAIRIVETRKEALKCRGCKPARVALRLVRVRRHVLRRRHLEEVRWSMPLPEYRQALRTLGQTQEGFAKLLGHGERTGQYWATVSVPASVATLVRLLLLRPELVDVIAQIAAERRKYEARAKAKRK